MGRKSKMQKDPQIYISWASQVKTCPECKRQFDWFGEQWVYRTKRNGKMLWYCSWRCWRAQDARVPKKLRGEGYARENENDCNAS